jgi:Lon protease-like protein
MSKFIAHFPLNVMVLPGEKMRLHIFEPRYKQLINECLVDEKTFGIPFVLNSSLMHSGSEVRVSKVITRYANGEMDIEIEGVRMFNLIDFQDPFVGKLYAGGNVSWVENISLTEDGQLINFFLSFYKSFYGNKVANEDIETLRLFDLARLLNLNNQQKYELVGLKSNRARQAFFVHQMRFLVLIKEQEKKLNNNFLLN